MTLPYLRRTTRLLFTFLGFSALAATTLLLLNRAYPPNLSKLNDTALLLLSPNATPIAATTNTSHYWRLPADPTTIDPAFITTLITTEDKSFYSNPGISDAALLRAAYDDFRAHRIVSGGSTITMQVARLLSPHPRTPLGKTAEILRALQLAADFPKKKILGMYLTLAPYGGNIEGVQAASYLYFGHSAAHLTRPEICLLVALPRRPESLRPDRHPQTAIQAIDRIYTENNFGPPPELLPGTINRKHFPNLAPYLAEHLRASGATGIVTTTIDPALQTQITNIATQTAATTTGADIAILAVRNRDAAILAYIGGAGPTAPGASIDMIQAIRSPGSTLKPFIYGMAFDRDLATPATLIDDTPLANATYDPANFDRTWHGIVPVTVALQQSYNLPAVKMLQQVGPRATLFSLRAAGANLVLPTGDTHPSLAIALGGVGVSLNDLTSLYAGLAQPGSQHRISALATAHTTQLAIMTPQSAAAVLGILEGLPPPDGTSGFGGRTVAYKTGTSYGFRDAWSIGVSADYTVGVWVGRPDATPRPGAYGLNTAAPIMASVFSLLPPDQYTLPPPIIAIGTPSQQPNATQAGSTPQITFPPPNAAIETDPDDPVALSATGGSPPYRWIIDGTPQPPPPIGDDPSWLPPSPGFYRITAIDQSGQIASETVQIK
jgi:penicillin-binding protein 1C